MWNSLNGWSLPRRISYGVIVIYSGTNEHEYLFLAPPKMALLWKIATNNSNLEYFQWLETSIHGLWKKYPVNVNSKFLQLVAGLLFQQN